MNNQIIQSSTPRSLTTTPDRFSEGAWNLLLQSEKEAQRWRHEYLDIEHVLQVLFTDEKYIRGIICMKKYFISGSGRQGTAAPYDIVKFGSPKSLTIIDLNLENLNKCKAIIKKLTGFDIDIVQIDINDRESLLNSLENADIFLSAVPYPLNPYLTDIAIESKTSMVDLGGHTNNVIKQLGKSDEARKLMHEWVQSPALRIHMECVAACMAKYCIGDEVERDRWITVGLLHDFDYERHPTSEEHPFVGVEYLRKNTDIDEESIEAILGHATYAGVARKTPLAKTLFAVDELAGFIVACALVRPTGLEGMRAKSVKKKLKNKNFAAAVSREDINIGIEELDIDIDEHINNCIDAIQNSDIDIFI